MVQDSLPWRNVLIKHGSLVANFDGNSEFSQTRYESPDMFLLVLAILLLISVLKIGEAIFLTLEAR